MAGDGLLLLNPCRPLLEADAELVQLVDEYCGLIQREAGGAQTHALRAFQQGDQDLAKLLTLRGEYSKAESVLQSLPARLREESDASALLVHA